MNFKIGFIVACFLFSGFSYAELKSGIIGCHLPGEPVEVDFSELNPDSNYYMPASLIILEADLVFCKDSLEAPFGMVPVDIPDSAISYGSQDLDSAVHHYDSLIINHLLEAGSDTSLKLPSGTPMTKSVVLTTSEGNLAYLIILDWWGGGLDHFTFYWAYDTQQQTGIKKTGSREVVLKPKALFPYNIKGQVLCGECPLFEY